MNAHRSFLFVATFTCLFVLPALADEPNASSPDNLARYFGFGPMEIFKLDPDLLAPQVADLNCDGRNDLLLINNRKARIELLLQRPDFTPNHVAPTPTDDEDINDIFGIESTWRFRRLSYPLNVAAFCLRVADLNHDQLPDLAFYASDGLYVVLQQTPEAPSEAADQHPQWHAPTRFDISDAVKNDAALVAADLNHDQRTDLALLTPDGLYLLLQQPDDSLDQPQRFPSAGQALQQLLAADLDHDQRTDLLLLSSRQEEKPLRLRLQTPQGRLGPEIDLTLPAPALCHAAPLLPDGPALVYSVARNSNRFEIQRLRPDAPTDAHLAVYPLPATEKPGDRDIVAADLDADGLLDVIATDPARAEFLLCRATPTGLAQPESFPGFKDMQKLVPADLTATGRHALFCLSLDEKLIGLARLHDGRLTFPRILPVEGEPLAIAVADLDNDSDPDLLYVAQQSDGDRKKSFFLRSLLNEYDPARPDEPIPFAPGLDLPLESLRDKPQDLCAADIDHDGRADALILRPYDALLLVRQTAPGEFAPQSDSDVHSGLVSQLQPQALSLTSLLADAGQAALLARGNFARALAFDPDAGWHVLEQYPAPDPRSNLAVAALARLTPDGPLTLAAYDQARKKLVFLEPGPDGAYRTTRQLDVGPFTPKKLLAGHFTSPDQTSLLLAGAEKIALLDLHAPAFRLDPVASFESKIKNARFGELALGDLNHDNCPDLALADQNTNHVEILTFDEDAALVSAFVFRVFERPRGQSDSYEEGRQSSAGEPRALRIADLTHDGRPDLLLLVHDRLILYPQDY